MFTKFFKKIEDIVKLEMFKAYKDVRFTVKDSNGSESIAFHMHHVPDVGQAVYFGHDVPCERVRGKTYVVISVIQCHNGSRYTMHFMIDLDLMDLTT